MHQKEIKLALFILLAMNQIVSYDSIFQVVFPILVNEYVKIKKLENELITERINGTKSQIKFEMLNKYSNFEQYLLAKFKMHYIGKK